MAPVVDSWSRPLKTLRLSVTDRCNLRCSYCMPETNYRWLPRQQLLDFDEITRVVRCAVTLGVDKVRITGGEPLLRRQLAELVRMVRSVCGVKQLAITTNGILLAQHAAELRAAGLNRITVSLDTLKPDRFERLTRRRQLDDVLAGIAAAQRAGFERIKLDTVVMRHHNDDEITELLRFGRDQDLEVRFIEYMDVGGATGWQPQAVVGRDEILSRIARDFGSAQTIPERGSAPAERFMLPDGTSFGIIASVTAPFCAACDRARLTADGMWLQCLYADRGRDLKQLLRTNSSKRCSSSKNIIWLARVFGDNYLILTESFDVAQLRIN